VFLQPLYPQGYGKENRVDSSTSTSQKTCLFADIQCFREKKLIDVLWCALHHPSSLFPVAFIVNEEDILHIAQVVSASPFCGTDARHHAYSLIRSAWFK
jgi:hypothetical protein